MDYKKYREDFFELVKNSKKILITSHKNPDEDSIASVLSIYWIIKEKYPDKSLRIIYSSENTIKYSYFENSDKIEFVDNLDELLDNFDLAIILDLNTLSRAGIFNIEKLKGKSICIDHHSSIPNEFDLMCISPSANEFGPASNAELIYKIFLEDYVKIPEKLCELILIGILGDTGSLMFLRKDQSVNFDIVKRLVDDGNINLQNLKAKYSGYSSRDLLLLQEFIKNISFYEIKDWPKVSISFVTREFMETNMFTSKEIYDGSEMYIEMFGTSITDAPWGIVISPFGNGMKFGFRSRLEGVNARLVAEGVCNNEGRGGHNQASGGTFILENKIIDAKEGIEILINWLNNNQPTLIN